MCLSDLQELKSELPPFSPCIHPVCGLHASGGTGWRPCTHEDCQSIAAELHTLLPMVIALQSGKCLQLYFNLQLYMTIIIVIINTYIGLHLQCIKLSSVPD